MLHLGRVHLAHESLEQRQMLDGSGPTVLTDAQYQARLAALDGTLSAALSGAATAREAADQAWKDAQSDSKVFYGAWEYAAYFGGELRTNFVSTVWPSVPGLLPTVTAADAQKASDIAKAKNDFDASEQSILQTEQSTVGKASSAYTLSTTEADAKYKSKVDTALFGLLSTSDSASAKYDAAVSSADATFVSTSQWADGQRDAAKASADAEQDSTLAALSTQFEASASAAVGAFQASVTAATAAADATQARLDAAADALVAYGTRLQDEIVASAQLWHDGAIIAAGLNQQSETTSAANGLADAKKKNQDQFSATVGQTQQGGGGSGAGTGSSSIDIGNDPRVVGAVSSATGQFQIAVSSAQGAFQTSVGIAADSFDAIMTLSGDRYDHTIADADAALTAAEAAAEADRAAAERAAEQAHTAAIASARAGLAETKANAEAAYEQSLATARSAYDAAVNAASAAHDQAVTVAKAIFDTLTAQARATWQVSTAAANDQFLADSTVVRADEATAENRAIAGFDGAAAIARRLHDAAVVVAAVDRERAIAIAKAADAATQATARQNLAQKLQHLAEDFAARATGIENGHRSNEVLETQALIAGIKGICDAEAATIQAIQGSVSPKLSGLFAKLNTLLASLPGTTITQQSTIPSTGSVPSGGKTSGTTGSVPSGGITSPTGSGSATTTPSATSSATQALIADTQATIAAIQKDAQDRAEAAIQGAAAKGEVAVRSAGDGATKDDVDYARALALASMDFLIDCVKAETSANDVVSASNATMEIAVANAFAAEANTVAAAGAVRDDSIATAAEARDNTIAGANASAAVVIARLERIHQLALANANAIRDMSLATAADDFARTTARAEDTLAGAISGASMQLVSAQGQAFLVMTVTTASAEAAADLAITAADGALELALASASAMSVTVVAAAESAHGITVTDAGLSLAATGYGALQGFFGAVSSAAGTFIAAIGAAVSNELGTISSAVRTVVNDWACTQSQAAGDAFKNVVSAGLAKAAADAQAEVAAYGRQVLADIGYQAAVAGADAKLVMQEALGASVFVHTVLPGLALITGEKARAAVEATGSIVAAINGLQATLSRLTVSATVQGAAAVVRHAVAFTKADMDHLVTVTVAAGRNSTDIADAGVVLAAVVGAASVAAFDTMTSALVVHTIEVGTAAMLMTARAGAAATLATHDLGLARVALQGAVGVAEVTWATSVANAQTVYDGLIGKGQVQAAERLRDPFVEYKAKQAQISGDLRTQLAVIDVERRIAAEQHAAGSGGFLGDWSKTFAYVTGGLQLAGSVVEIAVGTTLLGTSVVMGSTGVGIPVAFLTGALGAFLVGHGVDTANAGYHTIVTGVPQRTLTARTLDSLTGNEFYSDMIDGVIGAAAGAAGAKILRLAAMTDDMGRCMNMFSRAYYGGCFTGDTLVHVTAVADGEDVAAPVGHGSSSTSVATATQCLAIAKVPIGARVLAENPRPEDFDDSFPEPVQSEWARVSFLIVRDDLSVVEAEFIRPRAWIESLGLVKGTRLDLAVPELEIDGLAEVTAVRDCPPIAEGEGRVVTGRFVTRDVANVVRVTLANGTEIRATDVHPIWSVDREEWVPAGKLERGEHVDTLAGPVAVARVEQLDRHPAVYNLEVHGEHVYRITVDGVLVHNACPTELHHSFPRFLGGGPQDLTPLPTRLHRQLHVDLNRFLSRYTDDFGNRMSHGASNPGWVIQSNFTLNERLNALKDFYDSFAGRYPQARADFLRQLPQWLTP